jgi:predicted nucleic acid-binding protein
MVIFVDTSALLALVDINDQFNSQAFSKWQQFLLDDETLTTNNYVLVESISLAQRRVGLEAVRIIQERLAPYLDIDWLDEDMHIAAVERVLSVNRRNLSLVDCSSFNSMRRLGIQTVFTFDEHFREQGFSVIP